MSSRHLFFAGVFLLLLVPVPVIGTYDDNIILRHGVLFKQVYSSNVRFVDETYGFYVKIQFQDFINTQQILANYSGGVDFSYLIQKMNMTTSKLFYFIYSNFQQEQQGKNGLDDITYNFDFDSYRTKAIEEILEQLDELFKGRNLIPCLSPNKTQCLQKQITQKLTLLNMAVWEVEMEIITFMTTLTETIESKILSNYIISHNMMKQIIAKLAGTPFFQTFITNPSNHNIFEIYNLCRVEGIVYNTNDYYLVFRINFPLLVSRQYYTIYEVIPLYTRSNYDENYSIRLNAWWPNSKYMAVTQGNFMTFSQFSCRYIKILNEIICEDKYVRMRSDVDYCVYRLYTDNSQSSYCKYTFAPRPTTEFINLRPGVWFYSYNIANDANLMIRQTCQHKTHGKQTPLALNKKGTGIFMFEKHCSGVLQDNSYTFMSFDRQGNSSTFENRDINIHSRLPTPRIPTLPSITNNKSFAGIKTTLILLGLFVLILYILLLVGISIWIIREKNKLQKRTPTIPTVKPLPIPYATTTSSFSLPRSPPPAAVTSFSLPRSPPAINNSTISIPQYNAPSLLRPSQLVSTEENRDEERRDEKIYEETIYENEDGYLPMRIC